MKYLIILMNTLAISFVLKGQGQKDPAALSILEGMSKKYQDYPSFKVDFTHSLINPDDSKEDIEGTVTVKGGKYKLDLGDQEITNDGKTVWTYLKDVNEVNVSDYYPEDEEITLSNIFTIYEEGYKYVYVDDKDSGETHIIDLEPEAKNRDIYKIRMEIGDKDGALKSFTLFEKTGVKYLYAIDEFNGDTQVSDSYFDWDESKYPGVEVIDFRY